MAGGKDQSDANAMIRQQSDKSNAATDSFAASNAADTSAAKGRASDLYGSLSGGYGGLANTTVEMPGTSTQAPAFSSGASSGGGGGGGGAPAAPASDARFDEATAAYRNFMNNGAGVSGAANSQLNDSEAGYRSSMGASGGLDPNRIAGVDQSIQGLQSIGQTGGLTDADMARMEGGGVYDEFAKTGGLSAGDQANIRSRATSTIPQFYANMKDQANAQAATQGGYGPGQAALMARFGRGQAAAGADASLNAELGIKSQVNQGRLAGAAGMASSAAAAEGLKTGNQLAGLTGAGQMGQGLAESIRSGQQYGTTGLQSIGQNQRDAEMKAAEDNASYKLSGTQGIAGMAENDRQAGFEQTRLGQSGAALGLQAQGLAQQQADWAAQFTEGQKEFGLTGLNSLYSGNGSGEVNTDKNFALTNQGQGTSQGLAAGTDLKTGNKSWADYAAPIAGAVAGGLTGGASLLAGQAAKKVVPAMGG